MLTEWIVDATSYCKILFENTDGAAFIIKRSEKELVDQVCKKMEELSNIGLEMQECKKLIMRDVNNYINIISDDNIKFKGCFEVDRDYHKNHSKRIVAIATANYFIKGIEPSETLKNHLNNFKYDFAENYGIFDFCIGVKMTGNNKLYQRNIKGIKIIDKKLSKVTRYYVSNNGCQLIKKLPPLEKNYITKTDKEPTNQTNIFDIIEDVKIEPKERETNIEAGWECNVFNKYEEGPYDINYKYYINEVEKLIKAIKNE